MRGNRWITEDWEHRLANLRYRSGQILLLDHLPWKGSLIRLLTRQRIFLIEIFLFGFYRKILSLEHVPGY